MRLALASFGVWGLASAIEFWLINDRASQHLLIYAELLKRVHQ